MERSSSEEAALLTHETDVPPEQESTSPGAFRRRGAMAAIGALVMGIAVAAGSEEAFAAPYCCAPSPKCPCCSVNDNCCSKGCTERVGDCLDVGNFSEHAWECCYHHMHILCSDWYSVNGASCNCGISLGAC